MSPSVCIVGAGPSGLTAAKHLLLARFSVTVYEVQPRIGGLWPSSRDDSDGLLHPLMVTNQSKHTMQFSDMAWEANTPEFPRAWEVGRYLKRYCDRHCSGADIKLGARVEKAIPVRGGKDGWDVKARTPDGIEERRFDCLVVASGFFGQPVIPKMVMGETEVPVMTSCKYRDLKGLLGKKDDGKGGKILVVGGQMSGVEIAGTIAGHLSSAMHSPEPSPIFNPERYSVHHVAHRPVWVYPLVTSAKSGMTMPIFLPLDLLSYNLSSRELPLRNKHGHITVEEARKFNETYKWFLGGDQSIFGRDVAITGALLDEPGYVAMSDTYLEFVRSGEINFVKGRLSSFTGTTGRISPNGQEVEDVAAVVFATGFDPSSSLSFFRSPVLERLHLDEGDFNNPVLLAFHGTHTPELANLGFVGFYRSPYWGVMEMQARFLAAMFSYSPSVPGQEHSRLPASIDAAVKADDSMARTLALRRDPRTSQFPMGDYIWLMDRFAAALGIPMRPAGKPETPPLKHSLLSMDILTPPRFLPLEMEWAPFQEAVESIRQTQSVALGGMTEGKFVSRAVFRSLLGEWELKREVDSRLPNLPSGKFRGLARFLYREPTLDGRDETAKKRGPGGLGMEYLYVEEGIFTGDTGLCFPAKRSYVWRYDEARDKISVWFVRTNEPKRVDNLYHEVDLVVPPVNVLGQAVGGSPGIWKATGGHLCSDDYYMVHYGFHFNAVNLEKWTLGNTVVGPSKNYTLSAVYKRRQIEKEEPEEEETETKDLETENHQKNNRDDDDDG